MYTHTFRAMNTRVQIWLDTGSARARQPLREAEAVFQQVEATLSRFRPESPLSRVNREPGRWHRVPTLLVTVLAEALTWAERTQGLFDPTVLGALHAAGYTRSFEKLTAETEVPPPGPARSAGAWRQVRIADDRVFLPPGAGLDLGGIAKEWTADHVAELLASWGPCLVDAGGDLRAVGGPALWGTWPVAVAHPQQRDEDVARLGLADGGLATSSRVRRRWRVGDRELHHIMDPRTGQPAQTPVLSASVIAPTTVMAGVLSKVALLQGQSGLAYVETFPGCQAILVLESGDVSLSPSLEAFHVTDQAMRVV